MHGEAPAPRGRRHFLRCYIFDAEATVPPLSVQSLALRSIVKLWLLQALWPLQSFFALLQLPFPLQLLVPMHLTVLDPALSGFSPACAMPPANIVANTHAIAAPLADLTFMSAPFC
jgi:hypothetical protein